MSAAAAITTGTSAVTTSRLRRSVGRPHRSTTIGSRVH